LALRRVSVAVQSAAWNCSISAPALYQRSGASSSSVLAAPLILGPRSLLKRSSPHHRRARTRMPRILTLNSIQRNPYPFLMRPLATRWGSLYMRASVPRRTDADPTRWHDPGALLFCGHCGADRLIPLSHTALLRDDSQLGSWPRPPGRPIFKCIDCRRGLHVGDIVRSKPKGKRTLPPGGL
jgi:hypothetical protein